MSEPSKATPPRVQRNPKDSDDGLLDSIGKAITDPVKTGAEDDEPKDEVPPIKPPGR